MDDKKKVIVTGPKGLENRKVVFNTLDKMFQSTEGVELVCGKQKGIETIAAEWAEIKEIPVKDFPTKWKDIDVEGADVREGPYGKYNAKAGMMKNRKMVEYSTHLIAFYDGEDTGTEILMKYAERMGLKVKIFLVEGSNVSEYKEPEPEPEIPEDDF